MNIPTDAIVMTVVLIAGFIYFKMQKEDTKPKEIQSDEEEWLNTSHYYYLLDYLPQVVKITPQLKIQ